MPKKRKTVNKTARSHKKKSSQHPSHFLKVYWPYIPLLILVTVGMFFGGVRPSTQHNNPATLAYSTQMSISELLNKTNAQRANNGLASLTLNSQLNSSAQAKSNDMVSKDYWAHNTPSGQEPWVFFDAAGYKYQKAGENLAYGFATSADTIVGWMNSPSHRANLLDTSYTEVGFGFTNSENFVGTGQETVVVAHYAKPLNASTPAPAPVSEPVANSPPKSEPQALPASETKSVPEETVEEAPATEIPDDSRSKKEESAEKLDNKPVSTDSPVPTDSVSLNITRLQSWTQGNAIWSAAAVSIASFIIVILWLVKHALLVKRFVLRGEHFVAHHPVVDLVIVAITAIAIYLSQTSGVVI